MHIPDNYLSPSTCIVLGATMIPIWRRAALKVKDELSRKKIPLLGVASAFSFLIMMFNVPLPGGTTGHAVGGTLIAILLGPYSAVISITITLVIQALFFGDGGILALGANAFNMAFIIPFAGYYIYKFIKGKGKSSRVEYISIFIASYLALNIGAFITALEFGIQPILFKSSNGLPLYCPYPINISIPAMLLPHLIILGIIEGIITTGVHTYIKKQAPDAIYEGEKISRKRIYLSLIIMILLTPLGILASGTSFGEWGIGQIEKMIGYVPRGMQNGFKYRAAASGYQINGLSKLWGYMAAAFLGVVIIMILVKIINKIVETFSEG